jgi:hypothetical protein
MDMSYTDAADIYLGDVSSQVYEFIERPRPCIFLNPRRIDWSRDPAYAHWRLGQVVTNVAELGHALVAAGKLQSQYAAEQAQAFSYACDDCGDKSAAERGAQVIAEFLLKGTGRLVVEG